MRFFLHVGAGKTGTSAVQTLLVQNRQALADAGLHYPRGDDVAEARAAAGEVNSGNGTVLARFVHPARRGENWDERDVDRWLARCVAEADGRDVLVSSEALQMIPAGALTALAGKIDALGAAVHVIFYVRHVLDVRVSTFAQFVKMGLVENLAPEDRDLDSFVARTRLRWHVQLRMLAATLGRDRVHCRLYDADRADLPRRFLSVIDPRLGAAVSPDSAGTVVNRTPNIAEFMVFEALNRLPVREARLLCQLAMNTLLNRGPLVEAPRLHVSPEAYARLAAAEQPMVDAVNAEFLSPGMPLALTSGAIPIGAPPLPDPRDIALLAAHVMAATARTRAPGAPARQTVAA